MDNSLGEYRKLVDALSESLETVHGGFIADNMWNTPYLGYLCLYARHSPPEPTGWFPATPEGNRKRQERYLWHQEMLELARTNWVGWNRDQIFIVGKISVDFLD